MSNYGEDETPSADMAEDKVMANGPHDWTTYAERLQAAGDQLEGLPGVRQLRRQHPVGVQELPPVRQGLAALHARPLVGGRGQGRPRIASARTASNWSRRSAPTSPPAACRRCSWIVTAADLSEHPSAEPSKGEHVCAELIKALVDHPEVFAKTVFIVNYDEAGGFYDHMQPPMPPLTPEQGSAACRCRRRGQGLWFATPGRQQGRLSAGPGHPGAGHRRLALEPGRLRPAQRCSTTPPPCGSWRSGSGCVRTTSATGAATVCGDLTSVFDFAAPNQDWSTLSLPATADYMQRVARSKAAPTLRIPERQTPSAQDEAPARRAALALRPWRPTPGLKDGRMWIDLANAGKAGAVFQVFDNTDRAGPWRFTLGAGERYAGGSVEQAGRGLAPMI